MLWTNHLSIWCIMAGIFIIFQILDYLTTKFIFLTNLEYTKYHFEEKNQFMRYIIDKYGNKGLIIIKSLISLIVLILSNIIVLIVLNIVYLFVVLMNMEIVNDIKENR